MIYIYIGPLNISKLMTRLLYLRFDKNLQSYELSKFRGAVIEKTGREDNLFHNHSGDNAYVYRYPLLQYKIENRKPLILCIGAATDAIHSLLRCADYGMRIGDRQVDFEIEEAKLVRQSIGIGSDMISYSLMNYLPFNQDNYQAYKQTDGLIEQASLIQQLLTSHINIFFKEIGVVHKPSVSVRRIVREKYIEYKKVFHLALTLEFKSNAVLPDMIGLGKGSALGFGIIKKIK